MAYMHKKADLASAAAKINKILDKLPIPVKKVLSGPPPSPYSLLMQIELNDRILGGNGTMTSLTLGRDYSPNMALRGISNITTKIKNSLDAAKLKKARANNDKETIKEVSSRIAGRIKDLEEKKKKWGSLYQL